MSYYETSWYLKLEKFSRIFLLIWGIYFLYPQFVTLAIFQSLGVNLAYTAYHWLLHIGLLVIFFIASKKYQRLYVKLALLPTWVFVGYIYFRYLQPAQQVLNPLMFYTNVVMVGILAIVVLFTLFDLLARLVIIITPKESISHLRTYLNETYGRDLKSARIFLVSGIIWGLLLGFANTGYGVSYQITDAGNEVEVGFWNFPIWGGTYSNYTTPEAAEELEIYQQLHGFFFIPFSRPVLENPDQLSNYTAIFNLWASYDIEIIFDASARPIVWDEDTQSYVRKGDFVTYHYIEETNDSLNAIAEYVVAYNITNFRGVSLDIEPAIYHNETYVISEDLYHEAVAFVDTKFAELKTQFPGIVTNMISMESIMWDAIDSDYDLSIGSHTMDMEINWDEYGYMTYHCTNQTGYSSYKYWLQMEQGMRAHGDAFQPWLGWWSNDASKYPTLDQEIVYNRTFEQIKMAKTSGAKEIVLAPIRAFKGTNHTEGMVRLHKLVNIVQNDFEPFSVRITRGTWYNKIYPTYWIAQHNIFHDILDGTDYHWYTITHLALLLTIIVVAIKLKKKN